MTPSAIPLRFRRLPTAEVASRRVPVAVTLLSRLLGLALLRTERAGEGLLIPRCRSVHTFGMRFRIHVVYLDAWMTPISVHGSIPANRLVHERGARAVVELPAVRARAVA